MDKNLSLSNWDRAYREGKYNQEGPIPFVRDIIKILSDLGLSGERGFYPGCGNGRNFVPLLDAGLDIQGSDISSVAIQQLKKQRSHARVIVEDFLLHRENAYLYLISLQLFQHGNNETIFRLFDKTTELLHPGGLFFLRVNSTHTQIVQDYDHVEKTPEGGFTLQYHSGPKTGQEIHFYTAEEITVMTASDYDIVMPLREEYIPREDGTYWAQWETILQKR